MGGHLEPGKGQDPTRKRFSGPQPLSQPADETRRAGKRDVREVEVHVRESVFDAILLNLRRGGSATGRAETRVTRDRAMQRPHFHPRTVLLVVGGSASAMGLIGGIAGMLA